MKALVIFFLAFLAVCSAKHLKVRPVKKFPVFPGGSEVYGASLGGAPVGMYSRESSGIIRGRYPKFLHPSDNVYAAALGGAQVGGYSRYGREGTRIFGASLQKAPVGMYSKEG